MGHLDPALGEVARRTEILTPLAARRAMVMRTGTAHRGHDEIARLELGDARTDLQYFAQRFVAEHQVIAALRRSAVGKGADLPVRATNPDLNGPELQFGGRVHLRHRMLKQSHFAFRGDDTDGSHASVVHRSCWPVPAQRRLTPWPGRRELVAEVYPRTPR